MGPLKVVVARDEVTGSTLRPIAVEGPWTLVRHGVEMKEDEA